MYNKVITVLVLVLFSIETFAQESEKKAEFFRLLITNQQRQLMVVKIKNTDFWVTPGLYSQDSQQVTQQLKALAAEYGLSISKPELKGMFILQSSNNKDQLMRHFYSAKSKQVHSKFPDNIETIKWLPLKQALEIITFPHIRILTQQVMKHPDYLWGATVLRFQKNNEHQAELIKPFYVVDE